MKHLGGGVSEPYRMQDFRAYLHDARPLISSGLSGNFTVNRAQNVTYTIRPNIYTANLEGNLTLDDILLGSRTINSMYYAVQITYGNSSIYACSTTTISNNPNITVNLSSFPTTWLDVDLKWRFFIVGSYFAQSTTYVIQDYQYPIYNDSLNINPVIIRVKEDSNFDIQLVQISNYINSGYSNLTSHNSTSSPFITDSNGTVYFLCTVYNRSSVTQSIIFSTFIGQSLNFFNETIRVSPSGYYNTSGTAISTLNVPANSSTQFKMAWNYNRRANGSIGSATYTTIKGNILLYYQMGNSQVQVNTEIADFFVRILD